MAITRYRAPRVVGTGALVLAGLGVLALIGGMGVAGTAQAAPADGWGVASPQAPTEIVVYASDLTKRALSEFDFWNDPASPGGKLVGTPNTGGELDPPPENDPHVTFTVRVQAGVAYRCWIHMKVGPPKGVALANRVWIQFTGAVDAANKEVLKPRTGSYLTAQGPTQQGWHWVACDPSGPSADRLVRFRSSGEVTVRIQAGMEGVGFDQFVLSPVRYLEAAPSETVVAKP